MLPNAAPYEEEDGQWYFTFCNRTFGPYHSKDEAWINFRVETGTSDSCPTCED